MKPKHEGKVFESINFGLFTAIEYVGGARYLIKFNDTGYMTTVKNSRMLDGHVSDKLAVTVCGVGFMGDGNYSSRKDRGAYIKWTGMLDRVYRWSNSKINYGYKDCTVCDEWHDFQNFTKWYYDNFPTDGGAYDLDKDKRVLGNKTYSPDRCSFIKKRENIQISNSKKHFLVGPSGDLVEVINLSKFMRDNNLSGKPRKADALPQRRKQTAWLRVTVSLYNKLKIEQDK